MSDNFIAESYELEFSMQKQIFDMESINAKFDELNCMHEHIAAFGIDSTFLRIYNRDNKFSNVCAVEIPSCENLCESPESGLSIAAMEGIGEFFSNIVDFITGIFEKIWGWIKSIFGFGSDAGKLNTQMKKLQDDMNKSVEVISNKANAVADVIEKAKAKGIEKVSVRKHFLNLDKFFDEVTKSTQRIDGHLTGSNTPDEIIPLMKKELESLNGETDYNPDNKKFKETEEVPVTELFNENEVKRLRATLNSVKYRTAGKTIHECVRKIQTTVEGYVKLANEKYGPTEKKKKSGKILKESREFATITAKYVNTIIHKTAAAIRLVRIYVREFDPRAPLDGKIHI